MNVGQIKLGPLSICLSTHLSILSSPIPIVITYIAPNGLAKLSIGLEVVDAKPAGGL
jgi:hypothetical protein